MGRSGGGRSGGGGRGGGFSGGGRSSGGFSGGGGHGRSGGRSIRPGRGQSHPGGGFGGRPGEPHLHPHRPPRPYRHIHVGGGGFWPFMAGFGLGRGTGGGGETPPRDRDRGGCGCGSMFIVFILIVLVLALLGTLSTSVASCSSVAFSSDITASTVDRAALPSSAVSTELSRHYYDEDGGWIRSSSTIEAGLESFYQDTGVQPYVWIVPNGSVTSTSELSTMADEAYDEVFDDEAGFLLMFCDDGYGSFNCGYAVGSEAKTVMDDEAINILADYLDRYYQEASSDEEVFSLAFEKTGERIMSRTTSPVVYVAVCVAVVIVAILVYNGVKKYRASKEREAKRMQDVLNTPLETFGDEELDDLEEKYRS